MVVENPVSGLFDLVRENQWLAEPIAIALGFAESIPLLSWLVPSSVILIGLGSAHGAAGGSVVALWAGASAGAVAGDVTSYMLGRYLEGPISRSWPLSKYPDLLKKGHDFVESWGVLGVLIGKFVGPLRPFIPLASGVARMAWPKFLAASVVSSAVWSAAFLSPGLLSAYWFAE